MRKAAALDKACDRDDARACAELARMYRVGDGVPRDLAMVADLLEQGCEAGEPSLCVEAGHAFLRGEGVKRDPAHAALLFARACDLRAPAGCMDLAMMLQSANGVAQDVVRAAALLDRGCGAGDSFACQLQGDARWLGVAGGKDPAAARAFYEKACKLDLPSSCTKLADLLRLEGKEPERADGLYRKSCSLEEKDACTVLRLRGGCDSRDACSPVSELCADYLAGYGVLAEPRLAREPCEMACEGGVGEACDNLADLYEDGLGLPQDMAQAAAYRKRACELGDRDACSARE